jgi:hypothetical protein
MSKSKGDVNVLIAGGSFPVDELDSKEEGTMN